MLARERGACHTAKDYGEILVGCLLSPASFLLLPTYLLLHSQTKRGTLYEELAALAHEEGGQEERRGSSMEVNTGQKLEGSKFFSSSFGHSTSVLI